MATRAPHNASGISGFISSVLWLARSNEHRARVTPVTDLSHPAIRKGGRVRPPSVLLARAAQRSRRLRGICASPVQESTDLVILPHHQDLAGVEDRAVRPANNADQHGEDEEPDRLPCEQ